MDRLGKLVKEIQSLREENSALRSSIDASDARLYEKHLEIGKQKELVKDLRDRIQEMGEESRIQAKMLQNKVHTMELEVRRRDAIVFNEKGTHKTKSLQTIRKEIEKVRGENNVLLGFVEVLAGTIGFNGGVVRQLCTIASGVNDGPIRVFLEGIAKEQAVEKPVPEDDVRMSIIDQEKIQ